MIHKDLELHETQVSNLSNMADKMTSSEASTLTSELQGRYNDISMETQHLLDELEDQVNE